MIADNEHNKYTTLYYQLKKKNERGDLNLTPDEVPSPPEYYKKRYTNGKEMIQTSPVRRNPASINSSPMKNRNNSPCSQVPKMELCFIFYYGKLD